jgi:hypothetical protein
MTPARWRGALVGVVALLAVVEGGRSDWWIGGVRIDHSIGSEPLSFESVFVLDPSKDIDRANTGSDICHFLVSQAPWVPVPFETYSTGRDMGFEDHRVNRWWDDRCMLKSCFQHIVGAPMNNIIGGGQAIILNAPEHAWSSIFNGRQSRPRWPRGTLAGIHKTDMVQEDIRPQLTLSRSHHYPDSNAEPNRLGECSKGNDLSCDFDTVFRRRLGILFLFGLGGFILTIWAGGNLDDDRRFLRPALIGAGILSLLGSLGLFVVTQYSATWCWLLWLRPRDLHAWAAGCQGQQD